MGRLYPLLVTSISHAVILLEALELVALAKPSLICLLLVMSFHRLTVKSSSSFFNARD